MQGTWSVEEVTGTPSVGERSVKYFGRTAKRTANGQCPVVFAHGFYFSILPAKTDAPWVGPYAAAGHPAISSELGGGSTWANATARARYLTQVSHMGSAHGCRTDKYGAVGESMGSILTLRMMWDTVPQAPLMAGVVLRAPVFNIEGFYDRNASFRGAIEAAHGGLSGWNAAKASLNASTPANRDVVATVADRMVVVYADNDELVPVQEVEDYLDVIEVPEAHRFKVAGTHITVQTQPAGGVTAALLHALIRRNS